MLRGLISVILLAAALPSAAQWLDLQTPNIPRTSDGSVDLSAPVPQTPAGRPDLSGQWVPVDASGTLFDPEKIQPWALDVVARNKASFFGDDPRFHCLPSGPGSYPVGAAYGGTRRIVQTPAFIADLNSDLTYRQIFVDGRELEQEPFPVWMGYSVGRWDGDTLIVESNGYNDQTWLHREGLPHTDALRITETYRRPRFGTIELEIDYDDPGTFTEPVQASVEMQFVADSELLEIVCNESSKGRSHYGGEISEADVEAVELSEDVLAKYVGTFEGIWLGNETTLVFTLEDGALYLDRDPPYSGTGFTEVENSRLVAQSDNAFDCDCGLGFVFTEERDGKATEVLEVHVSGGWTFTRVD